MYILKYTLFLLILLLQTATFPPERNTRETLRHEGALTSTQWNVIKNRYRQGNE